MIKNLTDYLRETAEFDFGRPRPRQVRFDTKEFTGKGRADLKGARNANARYGDNALANVALDEDELSRDVSRMDHLQAILNKAGVSDDEIKAGVRLTDTGVQKVAARLGMSAGDVPMLINSLAGHLDSEASRLKDCYEAMLREDARFSYEKDYLGNVVVRDGQSGKSAFVQGAEAGKLLAKLKDNGADEQAILAGYASLMEAEASKAASEKTFDDEIDADSGSYNMPWSLDGEHGTMTVFYHTESGKAVLELRSVRDAEGDEIDIDDTNHPELMRQARDFIGRE